MENSVAYSIVRMHIEKNQLVCGYNELAGWLERLHATAQITEEEMDALLQNANHLRTPILWALPIGEQVKKYGTPAMVAVLSIAGCL